MPEVSESTLALAFLGNQINLPHAVFVTVLYLLDDEAVLYQLHLQILADHAIGLVAG